MKYILLILLASGVTGCTTKYVVKKCDLPRHEKPAMESMETNEEFIEYLKKLLQEYELLLSDYEACRED